jgi:subtilisin family serine protease
MRIESSVRRLCLAAGITLLLFWAPRALHAQPVAPAAAQQPRIAEALAAELADAPAAVSFLVILADQVDPAGVVAATTETPAADALARRAALYTALTAQARQTQTPLRAWLDAHGVAYRPHYLVNMLEVQGDLTVAQALAQQPGVARLVRNPRVNGLETSALNPLTWQTLASLPRQGAATLPWGLTYTNADDVWALGFRGQNIVVAGQDTGVIWDHPALKAAYRGWDSAALTVTHPTNWFDAWGRDPAQDGECPGDAQIPCDDDGSFYHGTHTLGTVAGDATSMSDTVIGMAPDATWIACRNMRDGFGTPASYTSCFEFFFAPYPQGGDPLTEGKPELAPHVINNSWGCPPAEGCDADSLRQVVETMRAGGIFVAASAGNSGSLCSTITNPIGMHDAVISVGAHANNGGIASFSSRGPVTVDGSGRLKPDLSAPGVGVRSLGWSGGQPSVNNTLSGTSMAAPHVAGAVALLWSVDPQLIGDIDATEQLLLNSATPVNDAGCTGVAQSPNPVYGYGRLDILKAVQTVLDGRVAIAANAAPVRGGIVTGGGVVAPGATVTLTATANPGYTFVHWTEGGNEVTIDATYTFTSTGNRNLVANFDLFSEKRWLPIIMR